MVNSPRAKACRRKIHNSLAESRIDGRAGRISADIPPRLTVVIWNALNYCTRVELDAPMVACTAPWFRSTCPVSRHSPALVPKASPACWIRSAITSEQLFCLAADYIPMAIDAAPPQLRHGHLGNHSCAPAETASHTWAAPVSHRGPARQVRERRSASPSPLRCQ
jgi:hypothetical protein